MASPLHIALEFTRTDDADDPHAFRFERQSYTLRTAGGGRELIEVPWGDRLDADLAAIRLPGRDPAVVARVGETLRKILQPAGWAALAGEIAAAAEAGRTVVVTLRANAAELYALPWELTALGRGGAHLGALPTVLLRAEWPETRTAAPRPRPEGGRLLYAWSAAGGRVPSRAHQEALEAACRAGDLGFDPARDVLAHASVPAIVAALEADPGIVALHLLAHGAPAGATYGLTLDGAEAGDRVTVDAGHLRRQLQPFADRVRLVTIAACDGGNVGVIGNSLGSIGQALHRAGFASVIASRFPLSVAGSITFTERFYRTLLEGPASVEAAVLAARARLAQAPEHLDWASLQLQARAADGDDTRPFLVRPYRGLLAFQPRHARFFFGRDAERAETLADLAALAVEERPRFLVVAGASGTGKSSMVLAGAVPDLVRATDGAQRPTEDALVQAIELLRRLPDDRNSPMVRQAHGLLAAAARLDAATAWQARIIRPGTDPQAALAPILAQIGPDTRDLLIVVDQFEEVFTQTTDPAAREAFARSLWGLARAPASGVSVIVTIRVDFLGRCGELVLDETGLRLDRVAYDEAHRVFVAQMGPSQLRAAIEGPAAKVGLVLEAGLADRMLADVEGEPGALPLLSYTLDLLWQQRDGRTLTQAAYDTLGGVSGALHGKADALVNGLDEAHRLQARRLLVRLVGIGADGASDTRRRVAIAALRPGRGPQAAAFDAVLGLLVDARLLVRAESDGDPTIEVAHEALIRRWPRLRAWIQADQAMLAQVAEVEGWVAHWRRYGTLLQAEQLGYAQQVQAKFPEELSEAATELIAATEADRVARARRARQRLIGFAVAAGVIAIVMGALGIWGWSSSRTAEAQAARAVAAGQEAERLGTVAQAQARSARAALITANALKIAPADPLSGALVLSELLSQGLIDTAPTAAAGLALSLSRAPLPFAEFRLPTNHAGGLALSSTGDLMVVADDLVCLSSTGKPRTCPAICRPPIGMLQLQAAGDTRLLQDEAAQACALVGSTPARDLGSIHAAALSPEGRFLAASRDDRVERIELPSGRVSGVDGPSGADAVAITDAGLVAVLRGDRLYIAPPNGAVLTFDSPPTARQVDVLGSARIALDPATTLRDGQLSHPIAWVTSEGGTLRLTPGAAAPTPFPGAIVIGGPDGLVLRVSRDGVLVGAGDAARELMIPAALKAALTEREYLDCQPLDAPGAFMCGREAYRVSTHRIEAIPRRFGREPIVGAAHSGQWSAVQYADGTVSLTRAQAEGEPAALLGADFDAAWAGVARGGAALYAWDARKTVVWTRTLDPLGPPRVIRDAVEVEPVVGQVLRRIDGAFVVEPLAGGPPVRLEASARWTAVRFGSDGRSLAATLDGGGLALRSLPDGRPVATGAVTPTRALLGPRLAVVDPDGAVHVLGGSPRRVDGPEKIVEGVWSTDGRRLAVTDGQAGLWVIDGETAEARRVKLAAEVSEVFSLTFSASGDLLAWLTRTREQLDENQGKIVMLDDGMMMHPDGSPIGEPDTDAETGEEIVTGPFHLNPMIRRQGWPQAVALGPGELVARAVKAGIGTDLLLIPDEDGTPWLLTVNTANLSPSSKPRLAHALDPDRFIEFPDLPKGLLYADAQGGLLVTRSLDAVQITDAFGAGRLVEMAVECPAAPVAIGPRGRTLIIFGDGCPPQVLTLDLASNLNAVREKTTACLTREQRRRLLGEASNDAAERAAECLAQQQ